MKYKLIVIFLIAAAIMSGCRSSKNTSAGKQETSGQTTPGKGDGFARLTANYSTWNDVSLPVSIHLTQPSKFSISGRATMVRGKSIDISLRVLGFEMGRALITNDSAFVIIKPQRTYMAESLDELTKYVSFSTENIQDMLLGRPFLLGLPTMKADDKKSVKIEILENGMLITPRKQPSMANYGYAAGSDDRLSKLIIVSTGTDIFKADITYGGHAANTPAGAVASTTEIDIQTQKKPYAASLTWKWNNAKWNSGNKTEFSLPKDYRRVKASDLLKGAMPK